MLKKIIEKYKNKDVLILMLGTVISQAVPLLASFILTRIYTPNDFGLFQVYFSVSMILSVAVTFRYEMAIMLPEKEDDSRHVLVLSCLISLVFSIFIFLLVLIFRDQFSILLKQPSLKDSFFILPFTILVIGFYQSLNYWSNRNKYYKQLSISRINRSLNSSFLSVLFGFIPWLKKIGLILGDTLGQAISTFFLAWRILKKDPNLFKNIKKDKIKELAKRYKQFPLYNVPSGFLEKLSGNLPSLMLTPFFGVGVVGLFSLSQRMISLPGSVVARSIGDVFRQNATELYIKENNCKLLFLKTLKKLSILSIPPFVVLFFIVEELFAFVFGEAWREAGTFAQILMPMFLLQFIVSPLSIMFLVAEKQKLDFILQIFLFLSIISVLYFGYIFFKDAKITIALYSFIYSMKYIVEFSLSYKFSKGLKS